MSDDSTNLRQEFVTELESILESDEAYGSNLQMLTYTLKEDVINGKFKDSWNNRVYEFIVDVDGISYKPAAKLDSFGTDKLPTRFDAYSKGYASLFVDVRLDRKATGKRTKKPKCGVEAFGCGYSCINLLKTCRITPSGKKIGENQGASIGKERLVKLIELARKLNSEGDKRKAFNVYGQAKNLKNARDEYIAKGNAKKTERITQRETGQSTNTLRLEGIHDFIPLLDENNEFDNFKHPEVVNKISAITGMTKSESRASAKAVNAFTDEDYEKIRKAEYAGIKTAQIVAINRYLDKMPKFSGEMFRGKQFKTQQDIDNFVEKLKEGHSYELPAMSSFSSNKETATTFAVEGALGLAQKSSPSSVVFKITGNKSGVTVKHLSVNVEEDEVLVKKGAKYKINGEIETINRSGKKITIISLEEY